MIERRVNSDSFWFKGMTILRFDKVG